MRPCELIDVVTVTVTVAQRRRRAVACTVAPVRAMRVVPGRLESAEFVWLEEPRLRVGEYLVESLLVGLCGTDRELLARTPAAEVPLTLGHESLGRVVEAPEGGRIPVGALVVGVIRGACTAACDACRVGRFDQCRSSPLVERGLYGADGYGSERWAAAEDRLVQVPQSLGRFGVLVEPLSSLVKGRDRMRAVRGTLPIANSDRLLVAGAGPIGVLAAWLFGQDFAVTVVVDPMPSDAALAALGELAWVEFTQDWATIAGTSVDAVVDCSGSPDALARSIEALAPGGVIVLEGIARDDHAGLLPAALRNLVLKDATVCATVNASRAQYAAAAQELLSAPEGFLAGLLEREIRPQEWPEWAASVKPALKTIVRFAADVAD